MIALLLIDLQNDFFEDGALAVNNSRKIVPIINSLIKKFRDNEHLIIATKDWHPKDHFSFKEIWPVHCVQHENGSEFYPDIPYLKNIKHIVYKGCDKNIDSYSAFWDNEKVHETTLNKILKENNVDTLYICGLATDYCVKFSTLDALDYGYTVYVITDACKGVDIKETDSSNALEEMKQKGAMLISSNLVQFF